MQFSTRVDAVPGVDLDVVIKDRQSHLMIEADAILPQLISKARVVGTLQTADAKRRVNLHRRAKNLLCDLFVKHLAKNLRFLLSSVVESVRTGGWPAICSPPVL